MKVKLEGVEYTVNPLDIERGKTYKNFKGYFRKVIDVYETSGGTKRRLGRAHSIC